MLTGLAAGLLIPVPFLVSPDTQRGFEPFLLCQAVLVLVGCSHEGLGYRHPRRERKPDKTTGLKLSQATKKNTKIQQGK